jgi:RNA polymerase sigma-70 factor (ECF subfamily)
MAITPYDPRNVHLRFKRSSKLAHMGTTHHSWDWASWRTRCVREAERYTRSRVEAEDVAQEALLRAWRYRDRCHQPDNADGWMLRIARNEALRRAGARRPQLTEDPPEQTATGDRSAEADAIMRADVDRALATLTSDERRLLALRYVADLTQEAVAETLEIPEGTVKVRLHRLRKRLAVELRDYA